MSTDHPPRLGLRPGPALAVILVASATALSLAACVQLAPRSSSDGQTSLPAVPTSPLRPVDAQRLSADGGLECPAALDSADGLIVPEKPQGVDGAARLLPGRDPASLVVCSYPTMRLTASTPLTAPFPRSERRVL